MNSFKSIKHAMIAILVTSAFPVSATTYYYNSGTLSVTPFSTVESFTTNLPANGNYTISFTSASGAGSLNFAGDTKSWNSSQASSGYSASSMDISGSITSSFTSYYSSSFTITGLCISSAGSCSSSSSSSSSSSTAETTTKSQVKKAAVAQSRSIRKMVAQSRNRFIDSKKELQTAMLVADGSTGNGFLTQGQFEKLFGVGDGWNRFVQGDFELSHEEGQGNAGYAFGKVGWEKKVDDDTLKGVFVGAKLGRSNVTGTYVGDEDSIATSVGGFMVKRLEPKLYADGYISMEFSRNNQDLTSSGSSYTGDYTARTTTMGGNLTGITSYGRYELRHTGGIEYISTRQSAYTLSSTTDIALAESTTQLASVWYAPEFRVAKGKGAMMYKPSVTCEHARDSTVDTDCGGGVSVYYLEEKQDDTKLRVGGSIEQIGGQLRSDLTLKLEKKF